MESGQHKCVFWSAVFHTRDLPSTEKLDYFAAASAIMYALYYTILRLFHLYPRMRLTTRNTPSHIILSALCLLTYLGHITYLTLLPRFDYAYNMAFNLSLCIIHNLLWLLYALPLPSLFSVLPHRFPAFPRSYRPHFVAKAGWLVLLTTLATGLELFDFPPWWRAIDAHALWHLATAPIAVWWYGFLVDDANALSGNGSADGEGWKEQRLL